MRAMSYLIVGVLAALIAVGCISREYQGETFPATEEVRIFEDAAKIPEAFTVVGKYVCSGRYNQFTREELYRRAVEDAEKKGADGVLVRAYQIVPTGIVGDGLLSEDAVSVWAEDRSGVSSWGELTRDFGGGYGSIGKKEAKSDPLSYTRIVRADFIKFDRNLPQDYLKRFESPGAVQGDADVVESVNADESSSSADKD